jgi:hypothetical protein
MKPEFKMGIGGFGKRNGGFVLRKASQPVWS